MKVDWNHIYLLGWYSSNDNTHLTTWEGGLPLIRIVVTGPCEPSGPPMWDFLEAYREGPTVDHFQLHEVKDDETSYDWLSKAKRLNGIRAFGWYIEKGFERIPIKAQDIIDKSEKAGPTTYTSES